jgi:hypothetical protein
MIGRQRRSPYTIRLGPNPLFPFMLSLALDVQEKEMIENLVRVFAVLIVILILALLFEMIS